MQHKLQFNFLKILILAGLLFLEGPLFAQTDTEVQVTPANPTTNPTIDPEKTTEPPQEEHDTRDLEKLLKRYNTDQKKILEDASKLHNIPDSNEGSEVKDSEIEEMHSSPVDEQAVVAEATKKAYKNSLYNKNKPKVISSELSNSVRLALEPLQKLTEEELLKRLDESTKQSAIRPYMDEFPNSTLFAIRLIKDKESIPTLVKILEDRDRLIWFGVTILGTIIFGFILKRLMHREGRPFWKAALYFLLRVYVMFAIRIGVVYYFYSVELTPAARVFRNTFM